MNAKTVFITNICTFAAISYLLIENSFSFSVAVNVLITLSMTVFVLPILATLALAIIGDEETIRQFTGKMPR